MIFKINNKLKNELIIKTEINKNNNNKLKELGYTNELIDTKNKINNINLDDWYKIRKYTNKYEYPNISINPISRAYFKLWEIIIDLDLNINSESLHLAEAPGGFIEATINYKNNKYSDIKKCYTISRINEDDNKKKIRIYHKNIVNNINVKILKGIDNTGDITKLENILYIKKQLQDKQIKFITADGGFSENGDFNNKEQLHYKLFLSEILIALLVLKEEGTFVLKIYDIFTKLTADMIYILHSLFNEVYIMKPYTSRPTNSEKYIVCKNYNKIKFTTQMSNKLIWILQNEINNCNGIVENIPDEFIEQLKKINTLFLNVQINNINYNVNMLYKLKYDGFFNNYKLNSKEHKKYLSWNKMYNI